MRRPLSLWGPVALYMTLIFVLSSMSSPPVPSGGDKTLHLGGYMLFTVVVVRAVAGGLPRGITLRTSTVAIAIVVGYAITDEWHQSFVSGRTAELGDLAADVAGAFLGTGLCWAWGIIARASRDEL